MGDKDYLWANDPYGGPNPLTLEFSEATCEMMAKLKMKPSELPGLNAEELKMYTDYLTKHGIKL
jgi:hypothetical protein